LTLHDPFAVDKFPLYVETSPAWVDISPENDEIFPFMVEKFPSDVTVAPCTVPAAVTLLVVEIFPEDVKEVHAPLPMFELVDSNDVTMNESLSLNQKC
jgi:hypothetical protein